MSVFFYEPVYDLERLTDQLLFPKSGSQAQRTRDTESPLKSLRPKMDLHDDNEKNLITATFEFPGVQKEDIQISIQNGKLTVSAEMKTSDEHNENGYAIRERRFGKYARMLQLPQGVQDEEIKASMENGVLTITFPRASPELAPKRITVS